MSQEQTFAILIFLVAYGLIVYRYNLKTYFLGTAAILYILLGFLSPTEVPHSINWGVLGIFWGTLILAETFIISGVPAYLASILVRRSKNLGFAILFVSILSGFLSAFIENVATVLIVAPIALELAKRLKKSPIPFIIGIAVSSNLQGAATLIGDPPSMILASYARMTFNDFFVYLGRPSIFFAVEVGAISSFFVLYLFFRRYKEKIAKIEIIPIKTLMPTILLIILIIALSLTSIITKGNIEIPGIICVVIAFISLLIGLPKKSISAGKIIKRSDWDTMLFLASVFVVVSGLTRVGVFDLLARRIGTFCQGEVLTTFVILIIISILVSAFVDNVPFFTASLPIITALSMNFNYPKTLLLFGVLIGTTLGGNITPVGASANIIGTGILKQKGHPVSFIDFVRIGLPFSIAAVIPAAILIWIFYH